MNTVALKARFEKLVLLVVMFFSSVVAFAQEATAPTVNVTTKSTTTTTTEEWYTNPLYWVLGALLLITLIAIVARGNKRD